MPPRDGDPDGELLAQVIPLRRRASEPSVREVLADEPAPPSDGPGTPLPSSERSVWDQPVLDLRRRATNGARSAGRAPGAEVRVRVRHLLVRAGAAAVVTLGTIAIIGGLIRDTGTSRPASTPRPQYAKSSLVPHASAKGRRAPASSRSHRSVTAPHLTSRRRTVTPTAGGSRVVSRSAAPTLTADSRVRTQEAATTNGTPAPSSPQPIAQTHYTPVSQPSAESAGAGREFGFERRP